MKKLILIAALALLLAAPAARAQADDHDARLAAAQEYMQVQDMGEMIDQMLDQVAKNPQSGLGPADIAAVRGMLDIDYMKKLTLDALVKTFTLEELKMLTQFYGSPAGRSIVKKMPEYMGEVLPGIQQMVVKGLIAYKKKKAAESAAAPVDHAPAEPAPTPKH